MRTTNPPRLARCARRIPHESTSTETALLEPRLAGLAKDNPVALNIIYITHSTSIDNENGIASGHSDPDLSPVGREQAAELGRQFQDERLDAVVCFDLQRARRTAEIAFSSRGLPLICDPRCREVDYGELTRQPLATIDAVRAEHAYEPFPAGESYAAATERLRSLLDDAATRFPEGTILLVGSRATYIGLEHLCRDVALEAAVADPRPWQPQWRYVYG